MQPSQTKNIESSAQELERLYNARSFDSLAGLFTPDMQRLLERQRFFPTLMEQAGRITTRALISAEKNLVVYRTGFEEGVFSMRISVDGGGRIDGLLLTPFIDESLPAMSRNSTPMQLPFHGEWTVFWGGETRGQNHHVDVPAQKHAFDLVITDAGGRTYRNNGEVNEDYYAFGQNILAPCDAMVAAVSDSVPDNRPGVMNPKRVPGNYVLLRTAAREYILLAHLKQSSIRVKEGENVKQGTLIGICGNSGNSSEPHLHFHIQNGDNLHTSTGVKCYFDKIVVNGIQKSDYSPVKGDKVHNLP